MSFWSGETLREKLRNLVVPYSDDAVDCAAYTLRIGSEIYVSPDNEIASPSRHTKKKLEECEGFTIPSGHFAFLITHESVMIPDDAIAFISIKARQKFGGLVNISGFHVDPGYEGKLLFSVFNAGPRPLHLKQGQPLFLIWYADLDQPTREKKTDVGFDGVDPSLINGISGEILSMQSLSQKQQELNLENARLSAGQKYIWAIVIFNVTVIASAMIWLIRTGYNIFLHQILDM